MNTKVIKCLKSEMKICWKHFEDKISGFSLAEQMVIDDELGKLYELSRQVKTNQTSVEEYNKLFFENGSHSLNEFLQAMFDCFKDWQSYEGVELSKSLYQHTNRGTDSWFPVVLIEEKINEVDFICEYLTVYRGCCLDEYTTGRFKQRQSWSSEFEIAKIFAFQYPSSKTLLKNRVVIKVKVKKKDILWARSHESERVLAMNFSVLESSIEMTYEDFISSTDVK